MTRITAKEKGTGELPMPSKTLTCVRTQMSAADEMIRETRP